MDGIMAIVTCFAADFAPKNWALCNGQILSIAQNQALFALLGTTYGGNGVTTFALPDMRGRTAVGIGAGPGLSNYTLGEKIGNESVTLTVGNLPAHVHDGPASFKLEGDNTGAAGPDADFGYPGPYNNAYAPSPTNNVHMLPPAYQTGTIGIAGGSQPVPILSPYLVVNYIICVAGIFPSRN